MHPAHLLAALAGLTLAAWVAHRTQRWRTGRALRGLAESAQMRYVERDLFNLLSGIAPRFPIPRAGNVRVKDVIYGSHEQRHCYVFTAEYTLPPEEGCRREACAMMLRESPGSQAPEPFIATGADDLSLLGQYEQLVAKAQSPRIEIQRA